MNLLQLPEEILLAIAKFLPPSDLLYFSSVCKCFRRICFPLYHGLALVLPNSDVDVCLQTWLGWNQFKVILDLRQGISFDLRDAIFELVGQCTELVIMNGNNNWEEIVFPAIGKFNIRSVLIKSSVCRIEQVYQQCPFDVLFNKSQLVYRVKESQSTHQKSVTISNFCRKESFKVGNCINLSEKTKRIDDGVLNAMMCVKHNQCTFSMRHLNLDGTNISDENVFMIANCYPNLLTLSLNNCSSLSENIMNAIVKMSHLQNLSTAGLRELKSLVQLSNLHHLRSLDVTNCKRLNDISSLMEIINNFESLKLSGIPASLEILSVFDLQNLKELDIQGCYQVSDALLGRLKLPNLSSFNLSSCVRVTDKMLRNVICGSDRLVNLNLSWLKKITPLFFEETAMASKLFWRIEKLILCNMNITDNCLSIIQSSQPMSLHTLNVGMCKEISDNGLLKIAQIPTIQSLDLSHLCKITDLGIKILANRLYRLRELKITGCIGITDKGIDSLKVCRHLHSLECAQCCEITNNAIENLSETLPKLRNVTFVKKITVVL